MSAKLRGTETKERLEDYEAENRLFSFLEVATIICEVIFDGCKQYMNDVQKEEKTEGPEKSWYEEHWFKRKSINQQRETFHNIDRLNKMLLSLSGTLKAP